MPVGMTLQQLYATATSSQHEVYDTQEVQKEPTLSSKRPLNTILNVNAYGSMAMPTETSNTSSSSTYHQPVSTYAAREERPEDATATMHRYEEPHNEPEPYTNGMRYASYAPPPVSYGASYGTYNGNYTTTTMAKPSNQNDDTTYVADPLPFDYNNSNFRKHRFQPNILHYADSDGYEDSNNENQGNENQDTSTQGMPRLPYLQTTYQDRYQAPSVMASQPSQAQSMYATSASINGMLVNGLLHLPHSLPPVAEPQTTKKDSPISYSNNSNGSTSTTNTTPSSMAPSSSSGSSSSAMLSVPVPQGATQEAMIKVKTPLKPKYWRNGRRNLQCFPSCKVFGDYSNIKIEDLKQHDFMWGKCRGSVVAEVKLNSNVLFDDILILGRVHSLENSPIAFEEAVIRECMLGRMVDPDVMENMKEHWIIGERLPDFVQQDTNVACFEFKPKVWKYQDDMANGKCKRRNVKYYVQFEAFVMINAGDRKCFACIGSGMSNSFEVGSSRVLARQKRKAANSVADQAPAVPPSMAENMVMPPHMQAPQCPIFMHSTHPMMIPPPIGSMPPPGMFMPSYSQQQGMTPSRMLPPPQFPQYPQEIASIHHHPMTQQHMQQPPMQQVQQPSPVGLKRKHDASQENANDRANKIPKTSAIPI